jgi:hypothetical protein
LGAKKAIPQLLVTVPTYTPLAVPLDAFQVLPQAVIGTVEEELQAGRATTAAAVTVITADHVNVLTQLLVADTA